MMSILKFEDRTPRRLEAMCQYLCDPNKTDIAGVFGIGVNPCNASSEMRLVQNIYHQENLIHEYIQVIFCFDMEVSVPLELLREVCVKIGQMLITDKRQVLGAIHYLDKGNIHCHYLINYVGLDGSLYRQKYSVLYYKKQVNKILVEYGFQEIPYYEYSKVSWFIKGYEEGLSIEEPFNFTEGENMDKNKTSEQKSHENEKIPWTIKGYEDNSGSVEEVEQENPALGLKAVNVNYSDENVFRLSGEIPSYSKCLSADTALTPCEYVQSGHGLTVLYPASSYYLLALQFLQNPKLIEAESSEKITDFVYDENLTTLFWICRDKADKVRLANFALEIKKIYTLVDTNAQEERITVLIKGKHNVTLDIELARLTALYQELTKKNPEYRIYDDSRSRANSLFKEYVSEIYEISQNVLEHETIYKNAGWQMSSRGWHYYSGNDDNCQSNFRLAVVDTEPFSLIEWVGGLLEIGDSQIMLPLLLHAHLGYTLKLFEEAGYNEQYILAMIGASGSKKTSLARVMFSLFGNALINFTSTDRAIELELMSRQDSTMILDDLSSGSDKFLAGKFEKILRQLGDSTGRKRSVNGGTEQDFVKTRCAVVLTAETDIDALSKSSKLRTLAVYLNINSLDSAKLKEFQDDELNAKMSGGFSKLEQYMTCYVRFLETHYQQMVEELKKTKWNVNEEYSFARQATIFNMLLGQVEIVLRFWLYCGILSEEEFVKTHSYWLDILERVKEVNEKRGKEAEPYLLFLQGIFHALRTGVIAQNRECSIGKFIGYKDKSDVVLFPDEAYDYVIGYYNQLGKIFSESKRALWDKLYELHLIEVYEQKNHKAKLFKKVKLNGVSVDCLWLKWKFVEQLLNQLAPEVNNGRGGNSNEC